MAIDEIIETFYKDLPREIFRRVPVVGQLCWVPITHLDRIPRIMDVERADPTEHFATKFEIRNVRDSDFKQKNRLPIKTLNLRETEELIIQKAKRRPCIIVSAEHTAFEDVAKKLKQMGRSHLQDDSIIVAPLYGIESGEHAGGFPPIMVARIRALMYKQFFFCPKNNNPLRWDCVARLDRLSIIAPIKPGYIPEPFGLSDEAMGVLLAMLRVLFGSEDEEDLDVIREISIEALPEEAKTPQ